MRLALLLVAVALAGCLGNARLSFESSGPGVSYGSATCDGSGALAGSVEGTNGNVRVLVTDGVGRIVYDRPLASGPLDTTLRGADGTWNVRLEASPEFDGRFRLSFTCA